MAGRLKPALPALRRRRGPGPSPGRLAALPLLLIVPVLLGHWWLGEAVWELQRSWTELAPMPPRMSAVFVREMMAAPKPAAQAPRAPEVRPPAPAPALAPAHAAHAAPAPEDAASSPAPPPETPQTQAAAVPAVAAAAPASATLAAADEPGPEWPLSTRLSYRLLGNFRGEVQGDAQVEWLREGRHYQMHLDVVIGLSFAPLIRRSMSSDGELTPEGIAPRRYDEDTKVLFRDRALMSVQFLDDQVRLATGEVAFARRGTQDSVSQFVQLTWLFLTGREILQPGLIVDLPLALPRKLHHWRYEVLGEETLYTPMGALSAWHLRPQNPAGPGTLSAEVWLAPTLQYLPVRIRIKQDEDTYIDLMLRAPPLQAAP
jgi:hypothetical protein